MRAGLLVLISHRCPRVVITLMSLNVPGGLLPETGAQARFVALALPANPDRPGFPNTLATATPTPLAAGGALSWLAPRLDGLSRESGRGMAYELQGGLVKAGEAPLLEICAGQCLYTLQPGADVVACANVCTA